MTFEELAAAILALTPEQRKRPAVIAMQDASSGGLAVLVEQLMPIHGFHEDQQMVIWYYPNIDQVTFKPVERIYKRKGK